MKEIHPAISKDLIISELTKDKFIRTTNRDKNEIYEITAHTAPNSMREIGRLREMAYRSVGSGTGKDLDIDALDTAEKAYVQMIVWDPEEQQILGGYRYKPGWDAFDGDGELAMGTSRLFQYSDHFIQNYLPQSIELGRSFIVPDYQSTSEARKALFVLDNLWDGLGSLIVRYPQMKYFIGQVSLYKTINPLARDLVLYFFEKFCYDNEELIRPKSAVNYHHPKGELEKYFNEGTRDENYRNLVKAVKSFNAAIPPLISTYINITPHLYSFGTVDNPYFYNMEDTGIMIKIDDIYSSKKERHL